MLSIRRSEDRGGADHGWLKAKHSFSFGDYFDPENMGFRTLRVINEDVVAPGTGFGMHPHRDMEIITWILDGELEHKDSLGNGAVLRPGEAQRISAGKGVRHSEFNASKTKPVHLLQMWIEPRERGVEPAYGQKEFEAGGRNGRLQPIASPDGRDGSMVIQQDASLMVADLGAGDRVAHEFEHGGHGWVQVARGNVRVNGETLKAGDAAVLSDERSVEIAAEGGPAQVLVFDLP